MMNSVNEFLRSKSDSLESDRGYAAVKKKSRKELRKEKRKQKKARMKLHYEGKKERPLAAETSACPAAAPAAQTKPPAGKDTIPKSILKKDSGSAESGRLEKRVRVQAARDPQQGGAGVQRSRRKALLEANVQEEREIRKLERLLGLRRRKNKTSLPQAFVADGLDYILGALGSGEGGSDEEVELKDKLDQLAEQEEEEKEDDDDDAEDDAEEEATMSEGSRAEEEEGSDEDAQSGTRDVDVMDVVEEEDDDEEEEDDHDCEEEEEDDHDEEEEAGGPQCKRFPPVQSADSSTKYVPPHLREVEGSKRKAELERLTRTVKGLVNRLSESNVASISGQLEELYMSHSRKDMNETLTAILLAACAGPALTPDRLLMEHVLLVSVLHHTVGLEVGAHFLETVVRRFDEAYRGPAAGKECDNLLSLVAHLYNFQVVHALLVFDILRRLAAAFTEKDIELILLLLRNVGFSLRKDDAASLRELIADAQRQAAALGPKFRDQTRVRFMLETMLALKNNDMRKIPGYDPEPVEKLRKLQRSLVQQSSRGGDVKLRVSLENLLAAEQVGRWWIVGSSWSGAPMIEETGGRREPSTSGGQFSAKVLELARKQRMNTDIRRNIFCVIMTSEDYLDAFEKLLRLGLKDQQEREIIRVLLDCCLQEKVFNAFYSVLTEKFCAHDRRFQMTLQFSLWDKLKELQSLSSGSFGNLVQLLVRLLQKKTLSPSILKVIEFGELDKVKVRFLRQVLSKLLTETEHEELADIFGRISGIPKLAMLREALKLFIGHFLLRSAPPEDNAELAQRLAKAADVAIKALVAKDSKLKL
ncbi:nucleolar MIF4G domain-containing protein 1-like [Scleropages formosus]|uniref:Nucleolar MIF4G domain-containing protein 1 n=1 Tax=Scleropages formosus TaxID=113540 RepID=A0A0P7UI75_SCLFO|nr:nucleolar MIF4G domain-containing protein 1-like [Scleropages formosus]